MTLTQRTIKWLEVQGFTAGKVEHYSTFSRRTHDLYGFIDIVAVRPGEIVGVQSTSVSNLAAHRHKIEREPRALAWQASGGRTLLIGWKKVRGRYQCQAKWLFLVEDAWCASGSVRAVQVGYHGPDGVSVRPYHSEREGSQAEAVPCQPDRPGGRGPVANGGAACSTV